MTKAECPMRLIILVLPFVLAIVGPTNAGMNEVAQRQIIQHAVASAFTNGRFDELDTMADQFRMSRERTESGVWKLTIFYSGFNYALLDPNFSAASLDRFEAQTLAWIKARPNSPAAKIAYALALSQRAWFLRGDDYYNKLTDQQRLGYITSLRKRRDHLLAIKEEVSKDPHWFTLMVAVAKEEGWPDEAFDRLVTEAAEHEPYYYQTYFLAIDRNLPQWGGSAEKMNAVVARATDYTRELDGDSFKARGYWYASSYGRAVFDREKLVANWSEVAQGFQDLLSRYPDQWNHNAYAKFACLAKDRTRFLDAYSLIEGVAMADVWDYPGQDMQCAAWAKHPERNIEVK